MRKPSLRVWMGGRTRHNWRKKDVTANISLDKNLREIWLGNWAEDHATGYTDRWVSVSVDDLIVLAHQLLEQAETDRMKRARLLELNTKLMDAYSLAVMKHCDRKTMLTIQTEVNAVRQRIIGLQKEAS